MRLSRIRPLNIFILTHLFLFLSVSCPNAQPFRCTGVVEGNTIILNKDERVRLIGVDTFETKHHNKPVEYFAKKARAFTKKMVEGKEVRLEYDQQQRNKYGVLLVYVYLADGTFLNAEIIKQGYGNTYTRVPFKYMDEFRQYEKEAREAKRGLWADKPAKKEPKYIQERYMGTKDSNIYHLPTCALIRKVNPLDRRMFNSVKKAVDAGYVPCQICKPPYYK
jgi:micrococcal nuclease